MLYLIIIPVESKFNVSSLLPDPLFAIMVKSELTDRQKEILTLLKQSSLNGAQMLNKLTGSSAIRTVQVDLTQLEKLGLIKREGKARATTWKLVEND